MSLRQLKANFIKKRDSPCRHDAYKRHCWDKLGVVDTPDLFLIWRCSQCKKIIYEPLEELMLDENGVPYD